MLHLFSMALRPERRGKSGGQTRGTTFLDGIVWKCVLNVIKHTFSQTDTPAVEGNKYSFTKGIDLTPRR